MSEERKHLMLEPVSFKEASDFVLKLHRHHIPPIGHKFSVGCVCDGKLVGVCMVGRPVSRMYDDGKTLEVNRTCTDGTKNANSFLYGAATRAAWALGYSRLITYTRSDESGSSLTGAGWKVIARREPRSWAASSKVRERTDKTEPFERLLWEAPLP